MLCPVSGRDGEAHPKGPPFMPSLVAGGVLGIISGVTGLGGGIFLAPGAGTGLGRAASGRGDFGGVQPP